MSAGAGKKLRVLAFVLVVAGTVIARFECDADGTELTGQMSMPLASSVIAPYNRPGGSKRLRVPCSTWNFPAPPRWMASSPIWRCDGNHRRLRRRRVARQWARITVAQCRGAGERLDVLGVAVVGSKLIDTMNGIDHVCTATNGTNTVTWTKVGLRSWSWRRGWCPTCGPYRVDRGAPRGWTRAELLEAERDRWRFRATARRLQRRHALVASSGSEGRPP